MKISTQNAKRLITRFENAVANKAFQGSYPVMSDDPGEQQELDAIHYKIDRDYDLAKRALTMFCFEAVIGDGA